jgi:hypothetical protein
MDMDALLRALGAATAIVLIVLGMGAITGALEALK